MKGQLTIHRSHQPFTHPLTAEKSAMGGVPESTQVLVALKDVTAE